MKSKVKGCTHYESKVVSKYKTGGYVQPDYNNQLSGAFGTRYGSKLWRKRPITPVNPKHYVLEA